MPLLTTIASYATDGSLIREKARSPHALSQQVANLEMDRIEVFVRLRADWQDALEAGAFYGTDTTGKTVTLADNIRAVGGLRVRVDTRYEQRLRGQVAKHRTVILPISGEAVSLTPRDAALVLQKHPTLTEEADTTAEPAPRKRKG